MSAVSQALKKHAPKQLNLGPRLYGNDRVKEDWEQEFLFKAVGKYADVVSYNYYHVWTPEKNHLTNWTQWSGKPFIISEWYVKGEDTSMENKTGAGWVVKTQKDRGLFYQNYTLALLESQNCVGWHWFRYQDNDTVDEGVDTRIADSDVNKGIVDGDYTPYVELLAAMREVNMQLFDLIDYFDGA